MTFLAWRLWLPVVLCLSWELTSFAGLSDKLFFPPPSLLITVAWEMLRTGELLRPAGETLWRTLLGFGLGAVAGLLAGVGMGVFAGARKSMEGLLSTLISSPKISLLPILMLVLGVGDRPRIALIATAAFVVVALQTTDAIRQIAPGFVEMARNYGAKGFDMVRWVYLPGSLPQVLSGLRIGLGRALGVCVAVEVVSGNDGLGHMIWKGWQTFATERIYIGVLAVAILGGVLHALMKRVEKALTPWRG